MEKTITHLSEAELAAELNRLKDDLCDIEDMHAYATGKTAVHVGGATARTMQEEFDEECRVLSEKIAAVKKELNSRRSSAEN